VTLAESDLQQERLVWRGSGGPPHREPPAAVPGQGAARPQSRWASSHR
jgi:hypothetical protein